MADETSEQESRKEKRAKGEIIKGLNEEQSVKVRATKPEKVADQE